jgi:hypothetical protein
MTDKSGVIERELCRQRGRFNELCRVRRSSGRWQVRRIRSRCMWRRSYVFSQW